jgi:hypothetical protein
MPLHQLDTCLTGLKQQGISVTQGGAGDSGSIFEVMGFMLTAEQIVELHQQGQMDANGIKAFAKSIKQDLWKHPPEQELGRTQAPALSSWRDIYRTERILLAILSPAEEVPECQTKSGSKSLLTVEKWNSSTKNFQETVQLWRSRSLGMRLFSRPAQARNPLNRENVEDHFQAELPKKHSKCTKWDWMGSISRSRLMHAA